MDLVVLLIWVVTMVAGLYLLAAVRPSRRAVEDAAARAAEPAETREPTTAGVPAAAAAAYAAGSRVPPINHTRITTRPDEHPLLEFMHPALAIIGLGCWIAFVTTRFTGFAWIAFGIIVAAIAAGLTWFAASARAKRRAAAPDRPDRPRPTRLFLMHGSAAAVTLLLAVLTALTAHHA